MKVYCIRWITDIWCVIVRYMHYTSLRLKLIQGDVMDFDFPLDLRLSAF